MAIDPIRAVDDEARQLARTLLRTVRAAALATLDVETHGTQTRGPFASLVSTANDADGAPIILISRLSGHTANLEADPRCSLLITQTGKGDPLAHPRMTLVATGHPLARDSEAGLRVRRRFLARHPKAQLYVDFPDFAFWCLDIARISLNGGFGKAYEPSPADILTDLTGAEAILAAEDGAIAHMNADHADAARLYATALLGATDGPWRVTGVDPDGIDLALGEQVLRLPFPHRVTTPGDLRATLAERAAAARAK